VVEIANIELLEARATHVFIPRTRRTWTSLEFLSPRYVDYIMLYAVGFSREPDHNLDATSSNYFPLQKPVKMISSTDRLWMNSKGEIYKFHKGKFCRRKTLVGKI